MAEMDIQVVKLNVMQKIMSISKASLLKKIDKLLEDELIVGYTVDGQPLTKELYNSRLDAAEEQLFLGKYTHKRIWKKNQGTGNGRF